MVSELRGSDRMTLIRFSEKCAEKVFDNLHQGYISKIIAYVINSKYRKSIDLTPWIKRIILYDSKKIDSVLEKIPTIADYDIQMHEVFKYVVKELMYVGDNETWGMREYWAYGEQTLLRGSGDCEDGAILMYELARKKGIPSNRLFIWVGMTESGAHCSLLYRPKNYPLCFAMMDWCLYRDMDNISKRDLYLLGGKNVARFQMQSRRYNLVDSPYLKTWFLFNENYSYSEVKWK